MHTVLGLTTLLLIALGTWLALGLLPRIGDWSRRRAVLVGLLAAPMMSLGLAGMGLHIVSGRPCWLDGLTGPCAPGLVVSGGMGLAALGGLGLGLMRLALTARVVAGQGRPAEPAVEALVAALAARLGVARPRLLLCADDRPLAFTCGLRRPTVLLSTWLVEHLDARELEAVLAHELGHIVRRDYLVGWLATVLRDAFCYLPTSWLVHRQLQVDKELACDDLAVGVTRRPLALASALAKVWQRSVGGPRLGLAQPLAAASQAIEDRIHRLLGMAGPERPSSPSRLVAATVAAAGLAGGLILEAPIVVAGLGAIGCSPASLLGRFL